MIAAPVWPLRAQLEHLAEQHERLTDDQAPAASK